MARDCRLRALIAGRPDDPQRTNRTQQHDLKGTIKARADKLGSSALVSAEVSAQTEITEKLTIEVEAQVRSRTIIGI